MVKKNGESEVLRCSFCNKDQNDVRKLIAGPTVFICDECVEVCNDIIADDNRFESRGTRASTLPVPQEIKKFLDEYVIGQETDEEEAGGRGLQPLQADRDRRSSRAAGTTSSCTKSNILLIGPTGTGKTLLAQTLAQAALGPLHDRRRDDADRGRLRRRGRREHHPEAAAGGGQRHGQGPAGHHLHRRGRQDLPQGREPVDHARRLGRGRAAGAAEDSRGDGGERAAAGRPQAPAPGILPGRHDQHPVHLRRGVRGAGEGDRAAGRQEDAGVPGRGEVGARRATSARRSSWRSPRT